MSGERFSLVPRTMPEAIEYAKVIATSKFCPKDYFGREGDVLVAVQYGLELGIMPLQALQGIAVINGRPTIWGDLAKAVVLGSGLVDDWDETDPAEAQKKGLATCTAKRKGQATPISRTFSIEDAKKARLWGKAGPWTDYPGRMLVMRARSWTIRDGFADVLRGLQMREEVQDYDIRTHPEPVPQTKAPAIPKATEPVRVIETTAVVQPADDIPVQADEQDDGCPSDLKRVLDAIKIAENAVDLQAAAALGAELSDDLKHDARAAYKARLAVINGGKK